jgi:hypothetical protein
MKAAWAGIHRRDQHELRGEDGGSCGSGDGDATFLAQLPQHFEHSAIELRHLVEKQDAVMDERDLAGPRNRAAASLSAQLNRALAMRRPSECRSAILWTVAPGGAPAL